MTLLVSFSFRDSLKIAKFGAGSFLFACETRLIDVELVQTKLSLFFTVLPFYKILKFRFKIEYPLVERG